MNNQSRQCVHSFVLTIGLLALICALAMLAFLVAFYSATEPELSRVQILLRILGAL